MADSYLEDDRVEIDLMTEEMSDMRSRIEEYRIRRGTAADDTERRRIDDETDKLRIELTQSQRDFRGFRRDAVKRYQDAIITTATAAGSGNTSGANTTLSQGTLSTLYQKRQPDLKISDPDPFYGLLGDYVTWRFKLLNVIKQHHGIKYGLRRDKDVSIPTTQASQEELTRRSAECVYFLEDLDTKFKDPLEEVKSRTLVYQKNAGAADHVDILGNHKVLEDILRIASGNGEDLDDAFWSNILEIARRIPRGA
ncbi:hypothetical protein SeLEV6574_g03615 [Synchytrium endobioticum]|uniref:Uncharacterized protein n=1 Tax=Synchytrium endobioticum TaxID=286115 RepID=A0A507D2Y8_9FUNG|nr:hypothetical protein SeLEV6574_g03615 [Synchytrium endobioticum]